MPEAVMFHYANKLYTVPFTQSNAMLPVRLKDGACQLVKWGRKEQENSELPLGGLARLTSIKGETYNRWQMYFPKPVQISVNKFMEKILREKLVGTISPRVNVYKEY